jgi:2-C-methyl-D-erythritol 4-phosphate cytidylyltransferase
MIPKCDVVLVAGGNGERYKSEIPKQFEPVNGQPLYLWSLNTFLNWKDSGLVVVVVPADWVEPVLKSFENLESKNRVRVVAGGQNRQGSASRGVSLLSEISENEWVMIHDAARPAITEDLISSIWNARRLNLASAEVAGVVPGVKASETIKEVEPQLHHALVTETLPREFLRIIQTPQLCRRDLLLEAYKRFPEGSAVDDACLLEKLGYKVVVVDGDYDNVKVTFLEDRERVTRWLRNRHPSL